jgi:hypothetical protein
VPAVDAIATWAPNNSPPRSSIATVSSTSSAMWRTVSRSHR